MLTKNKETNLLVCEDNAENNILLKLLKKIQQIRNFRTLLNLSLQVKGSQKIMTSLSKTKEILTVNLFNSHYINIVEISSDTEPETISCNKNGTDEIQHILNLYKDHPRMKQIKKEIITDSHKKQIFLLNLLQMTMGKSF